ncbi:hypothetical protein [Longibacter sp.]|uniref:hypothetical protein n=1 Tax=Longibacter sp. TaxID=2045415 RepID=UPI003EB8D727
MRSRSPAIALGILLVTLAFSGCEWREIQRRNQLPQCVQENAGLQVDVYAGLNAVEANLLDSGALPNVSRQGYRSLIDALYEHRLSGEAVRQDLPSRKAPSRKAPSRKAICRGVADCGDLTAPALSVAYPHCYQDIAREYALPDSTGFWARQGDIWSTFFREGNWSKDRTLRALDATPPKYFKEFEVRAFYTQHALYLLR